MELPAVLEVDGIHNEVIMYVFGIRMGRHQHLISGKVLSELHSDLMRQLRSNIVVGRERLYNMVILSAVLLVVLMLHILEFITG